MNACLVLVQNNAKGIGIKFTQKLKKVLAL